MGNYDLSFSWRISKEIVENWKRPMTMEIFSEPVVSEKRSRFETLEDIKKNDYCFFFRSASSTTYITIFSLFHKFDKTRYNSLRLAIWNGGFVDDASVSMHMVAISRHFGDKRWAPLLLLVSWFDHVFFRFSEMSSQCIWLVRTTNGDTTNKRDIDRVYYRINEFHVPHPCQRINQLISCKFRVIIAALTICWPRGA